MTANEAFEQFAQLVDQAEIARRKHEQAYIDGLSDAVVASLYHEAVELGEQATHALGLFLGLVDKELG